MTKFKSKTKVCASKNTNLCVNQKTDLAILTPKKSIFYEQSQKSVKQSQQIFEKVRQLNKKYSKKTDLQNYLSLKELREIYQNLHKDKPLPTESKIDYYWISKETIKSEYLYLKNLVIFFVLLLITKQPLVNLHLILYLQIVFTVYLLFFYGLRLNQNLGTVLHEMFLCWFVMYYVFHHSQDQGDDLFVSLFKMMYFCGLSLSFVCFVFNMVYNYKDKNTLKSNDDGIEGNQ